MADAKIKKTAAKADVTKEKVTAKKAAVKKAAKADVAEGVDSDKKEDSVDKKETVEDKPIAKAGKRSAKALEEAEEKQKKEARKEDAAIAEAAPVKKNPAPITRPRSERRGKNYKDAYGKIDVTKTYTLKEAVDLAVSTSKTKFDSTLEMHVKLNVDPRQADQNIRGLLVLPAGTGKTVRVAVYADGEDLKAAEQAGADVFGTEEFLQQLDKEQVNFDVLIATPNLMASLSKYARLLGPKGLMPNPKSGTVTKDVAKAVQEAKAGKVEYRVDEAGIVHLGVGKVSFGADALLKNVEAVVNSINTSKPSSVKGALVQSSYMSTTMGPSIRFAIANIESSQE